MDDLLIYVVVLKGTIIIKVTLEIWEIFYPDVI